MLRNHFGAGFQNGQARAPEFSSQLSSARLLPGLPAEWASWPVSIEVAFTLTPNTCVYEELYREFHADNLEQALSLLFADRNGSAFVHYRFHGDGVIPAYEWYVSWPLARQGKAPYEGRYIGSALTFQCLERGLARRSFVEGPAPWDRNPDDTIFEIWNEPTNVYGSRHTFMLRVGGRTSETAIANWHKCAIAIRKFRRRPG